MKMRPFTLQLRVLNKGQSTTSDVTLCHGEQTEMFASFDTVLQQCGASASARARIRAALFALFISELSGLKTVKGGSMIPE